MNRTCRNAWTERLQERKSQTLK